MLFSSMTFLWLFLPVVLIIHLILPKRFKNVFLLFASLLFYSWGEPVYIILMLSSVIVNYFLALIIDSLNHNIRHSTIRRMVLVFDIFFNIGLLWYFKYFSTFFKSINWLLERHGLTQVIFKDIVLPLGISFYTFQILSYVIDVYKKECEVQRNILYFALYVSFFPQLVAGPIVKYKEINYQLQNRTLSSIQIAVGVKRFIYGLSKKVIISNTIASVADSIYRVSTDVIASKWLWIGAILYTLQIYYDFSGYSDMAIGLGRMFGFDFAENFDYPYASSSIREFWRRWHISLSTWFKEYIYIPLGGNRKGRKRTYINLIIVFALTGIWHGATLNFLLWGGIHGIFSLLERGRFGRFLERKTTICKVFSHIYTMFVVVVGWAVFRCDSLKESLDLLFHMFKWKSNNFYMWYDFFSMRSIFTIIVSLLLIGFIQEKMFTGKIKSFLLSEENVFILEGIWQFFLLATCMVLLIGGSYNPFIYFKF